MPTKPRGILIGITHDTSLVPLIREPRVLKVGIGVPKGRACYIYTHQGRWILRYGVMEGTKLTMATAQSNGKPGFATRQECEQFYFKNRDTFAISNRPQKIPFFTFTVRRVNDKGEESFDPDFAAIESHGDTPREIDIVFMGDSPLFQEYQAWSATELKCHGDGLNAERILALGNPQWPGWKEAKEANEKYFPVSECFVSGLCPYAADGGRDKLVCKPMTTLTFQLAKSIRLGATAYFTSTGFRTAKNLFSSLELIRDIAERVGSGIANTPLKLVLAPFRTAHNGIVATQYGVSLELRTEGVRALQVLLAESAWKKPTGSPRMITAADEPDLMPSEMTPEFYPEATFEDDEEGQQPAAETTASSSVAASETAKKTEALAERLKEQKEKAGDVPGPVPGTSLCPSLRPSLHQWMPPQLPLPIWYGRSACGKHSLRSWVRSSTKQSRR